MKKFGLLSTDDVIKAEVGRIVDARIAKLPELCAVHGVELGDWLGLVFKLAEEHVPGFRVVEPAGRPTEWDEFSKAEFKLAVKQMREANSGMKITDAIKRVQRLERWESKTKDMKVSALSKHYYDANPRWIALVEDAKAYESIVGKD